MHGLKVNLTVHATGTFVHVCNVCICIPMSYAYHGASPGNTAIAVCGISIDNDSDPIEQQDNNLKYLDYNMCPSYKCELVHSCILDE